MKEVDNMRLFQRKTQEEEIKTIYGRIRAVGGLLYNKERHSVRSVKNKITALHKLVRRLEKLGG